jgi:hypothetical protein
MKTPEQYRNEPLALETFLYESATAGTPEDRAQIRYDIYDAHTAFIQKERRLILESFREKHLEECVFTPNPSVEFVINTDKLISEARAYYKEVTGRVAPNIPIVVLSSEDYIEQLSVDDFGLYIPDIDIAFVNLHTIGMDGDPRIIEVITRALYLGIIVHELTHADTLNITHLHYDGNPEKRFYTEGLESGYIIEEEGKSSGFIFNEIIPINIEITAIRMYLQRNNIRPAHANDIIAGIFEVKGLPLHYIHFHVALQNAFAAQAEYLSEPGSLENKYQKLLSNGHFTDDFSLRNKAQIELFDLINKLMPPEERELYNQPGSRHLLLSDQILGILGVKGILTSEELIRDINSVIKRINSYAQYWKEAANS